MPGAVSPGTLVRNLSVPATAASFPYLFAWPFSQSGATSLATFTCAPAAIITCTAQQSISANGTLNGVLTGQIVTAGTFTVGGAASGYTLPTTTYSIAP